MTYISKLLWLAGVVLAAVGCVKEPTMTFEEVEQRSLEA